MRRNQISFLDEYYRTRCQGEREERQEVRRQPLIENSPPDRRAPTSWRLSTLHHPPRPPPPLILNPSNPSNSLHNPRAIFRDHAPTTTTNPSTRPDSRSAPPGSREMDTKYVSRRVGKYRERWPNYTHYGPVEMASALKLVTGNPFFFFMSSFPPAYIPAPSRFHHIY